VAAGRVTSGRRWNDGNTGDSGGGRPWRRQAAGQGCEQMVRGLKGGRRRGAAAGEQCWQSLGTGCGWLELMGDGSGRRRNRRRNANTVEVE